MLVPHVLNQLGKLVPVHQVPIACQFSSLNLHVVLAGDVLLLVDFQRFWPLLKLFKPILLVFSQQILLGIVKNALCGFRLLKLIISLDKLFYCIAG